MNEEIDAKLLSRCFEIEGLTKHKILEGTTNIHELVRYVQRFYIAESDLEEELYSEAIIYARCALLN